MSFWEGNIATTGTRCKEVYQCVDVKHFSFSPSVFYSFSLFLPSLCPGLRFRLAHLCFLLGFFLYDDFFPHRYFQIAAVAGSNGTGKRQQNQIESTPLSCYLNGGLGGLAFWPWSLCCQHFGWFVCDFIRNQNNSQMKRKIAYAKCCCIAGAVFALNTHSHIHTASQEHIKRSITVKVTGTVVCL